MADGAMRDALSLLDQCIAFYPGKTLGYENVLEVLGTVDIEVFAKLHRYVSMGNVKEWLLEAASISITFMEPEALMARHTAHSLHGLPSDGCSQFTAFASIFATVVLPVPRVPQNR